MNDRVSVPTASDPDQSTPAPGRVGRRAFLALGAMAGASALAGAAVRRGTTRLQVNTVRLAAGDPTCRLVHISDLHHKGDVGYAERVVSIVNGLRPDLVCFTGDLIEETHHLPEALALLGRIAAPLYGVPGNHEYWSGAPFAAYEDTFAVNGGAWLVNRTATVAAHDLTILGVAERERSVLEQPKSARTILLTHYPVFIDEVGDRRFTLILAGHSHGGQLRLPGMERRFIPDGVGPYDRGRFDTPAGPLYVNAGIGTAVVPFRINCPPEITLFEL